MRLLVRFIDENPETMSELPETNVCLRIISIVYT
jgi:hypothetical protein